LGTPLSNESRALLRMLSDGGWYPVADIKRDLAAQVPPGRALRNYESREASRVSRRGPRATEGLSDDDKIHHGRVGMANQAFYSMSKRHIEFRDDLEQGRLVRIRPDMLPVAGAPKEAEGPRRVFAGADAEPGEDLSPVAELPAAAFFSERQIRGIVADEIGLALDDFAAGLRGYLDWYFDELSRRLFQRRPFHDGARRKR
jgi:hypothetical protein